MGQISPRASSVVIGSRLAGCRHREVLVDPNVVACPPPQKKKKEKKRVWWTVGRFDEQYCKEMSRRNLRSWSSTLCIGYSAHTLDRVSKGVDAVDASPAFGTPNLLELLFLSARDRETINVGYVHVPMEAPGAFKFSFHAK